MQAGGVAHDLEGGFVGAHGAVGTEAHEHRPQRVGRFDREGRIHRQRQLGDVVDDAHREMPSRHLGGEVVEHRLHHGRSEFLRGDAVAAAHHLRHRASGPVLVQGCEHIQVERFALAAGVFAAIEYGDALGACGQRRHECFGGEGAEQAHLQHAHRFTDGDQGIGCGAGGFTAAAHQHDHPFGSGMAVVLEEAVLPAGECGEAIHGRLHMLRHGVVERVYRLVGLEAHVGVLAAAAQLRVIRGEAPLAVLRHQRIGHQLAQHRIADQLHPLDLMGGAEPIETMQQRQPPRQAGGGGDRGEIAAFLHRGRDQHPPAGAAGRHQIAVVAKDRQRRCGQRARRHMDHGCSELAGDFVEVGQHQQQPLRCRERGGECSGL